jgi:hypothetical protein
MFHALQFPQYSLTTTCGLAEFDRPSSERGNRVVEPTADRLFAFQYINRANYEFEPSCREIDRTIWRIFRNCSYKSSRALADRFVGRMAVLLRP